MFYATRFAYIAVNHSNKRENTYDTNAQAKMGMMKLKSAIERNDAPSLEEYPLKGLVHWLEKNLVKADSPINEFTMAGRAVRLKCRKQMRCTKIVTPG